MTMSQNSVLAIAAVFALLAVGGIAGYAMSQHDPSDSSEGTGGSGTNDKMQGYATDLTTYGGKIVTHNNALTVPMGTAVAVTDGDLVFVYSGSTYKVPYEGISYIQINHS